MWTTTEVLAIAAVTLLITLAYWIMKRPNGFPAGPMAVPILGSIPFLGLDLHDKHPNVWLALSKVKKYGGVFSIAIGKRWIIVLNDYASIKEGLVKNSVALAGRRYFDLNSYNNPYHPLEGIINGTYSHQWKLQRSTALQVLRRLGYGRDVTQKVIVEEMDIMTRTFKSLSNAAIDIKDYFSNAVSNVVTSLVFGQRYDYEDQELRDMRRGVEEFLETFWTVMLTRDMTGASLLPSYHKNMETLIKAHTRFSNLIQSKIEQISVNSEAGKDPTNFVEGYRLERTKNSDIENRTYQLVIDFILGGFETTTTAMGWLILHMLHNPDVQKKVQSDLDVVVGRQRRPTLADRDALPYIEATILESLRLAKVVPGSHPHTAVEDVTIAGYKIPKNTEVWVNFWSVLTDPDIWSEPDIFRPERFLDDTGHVIRPDEFVPFGLGRRACVGEQLAKQELFLFFTHLLHSFTLRIADGTTLPKQVGKVAVMNVPPDYKVMVTCR